MIHQKERCYTMSIMRLMMQSKMYHLKLLPSIMSTHIQGYLPADVQPSLSNIE